MGLLDDISKGLNFQDRYSDMAGAETGTSNEGFDRKELKQLRSAKKGGAPLSPADEERLKYLETITSERTRGAMELGSAAVGTVVGAYTGNPALVASSLEGGASYLMGEAGEVDGPNDGTGQQLQTEDYTSLIAPLTQMAGSFGGSESAKTGRKLNYASGGKMELRNRYNPRKHDYIKGNTFGFGLKEIIMATLTVTIKEELTLNGVPQGGEVINTTNSVSQVYKRIMTCTTTEQSVLLFNAADAAGTLKDATADYIRITHTGASNTVQLRIVGAASQYYVKLEAGDSYILGNSLMYADATGTAAAESHINIDAIYADATGGDVDVEIFAAL